MSMALNDEDTCSQKVCLQKNLPKFYGTNDITNIQTAALIQGFQSFICKSRVINVSNVILQILY